MPGRRPATTRRPTSLRPVCAVLAALVALALAGCSGGPYPGAAGAPRTASLPKYYDARALLSAVSAQERGSGGVLTVLNGTLDPPGTAPVAPGAPEPAGRRALTGDGALRFTGDGTVAARFDQRLGATGTTPRTTNAVRVDGQTWLRLPGADRWTEVGRLDVTPVYAADAAVATNIARMADPLAGVDRYADASLVADATDEDVDGVPTVRYTIVVDLVRASAAEADPTLRAQLAGQLAGGLTRISSVVWVDAQQRPVRGRLRQEVPGAGTLDLITDYRQWGTQVAIDPPPAS